MEIIKEMIAKIIKEISIIIKVRIYKTVLMFNEYFIL